MLTIGWIVGPGLTSTLIAQRGGASYCQTAISTASHGRVAPTDDSTFGALTACGPSGARALAAGMTFYRTETDVAVLEEYMTTVDNWRDQTLLDSALALANNNAASVQARVFAVRHLMLLLGPNFLLNYASLIRKADTTETPDLKLWQKVGCSAQMISPPHGAIHGAPLRADYRTRIGDVFDSLLADSKTPASLWNAANCAKILTARVPAGTR